MIEDSELLANLHLIKLFIWNKICDQQIVQHHGILPILEMKYLDMAFKEMQSNDLFLKISDFFLPFTISE